MKKHIFSFYCFLFSLSYLVGERIVYYKNPNTSLPIVITRNADVDHFDYTYYILNEYKNPVFASKEKPSEAKKDAIRERFFTSVEDYRRENKIRIEWNYRDDKKSDKAGFLKDGTYELHITETNKFQKGIVRDYVYYIVLDTQPPIINPRLSQTEIQKNNQDFFSLDMDEKSTAMSWRVFLDGKLKWEEDFPYGDERRFPVRYLGYKDYLHLEYGEHNITIIAKDSALNYTEKRINFKLLKDPFKFSIFSNKEVVFKKNGGVIPLYFTAIGDVSSQNWICKIVDNAGAVHYSKTETLGKSGYCRGFKWDGISEITNTYVPLGMYEVSISCNDSVGASYTQIDQFIVREDEGGYVLQDLNDLPLLEYNFENGIFHFSMRGCAGKIEGARLEITRGEEEVFACDVENAQDIIWDGCDKEGLYILSTGERYKAEVVFEGVEENSVFINEVRVPLILGELQEKRRQVIVDSIYFPGYEVDVLKAEQYFTSNGQSLKKTAEALLKTLKKDDVLVIVGNANYTTYPNKVRMAREEVLLKDISLKRAEMIKLIFMFYGVSEKQIKVEARGGKALVVPPNDKDNWKNRRVEFFIESNEEEQIENAITEVEHEEEIVTEEIEESGEVEEQIEEFEDEQEIEVINEEIGELEEE